LYPQSTHPLKIPKKTPFFKKNRIKMRKIQKKTLPNRPAFSIFIPDGKLLRK
jgi:hypothetical protein